MACIFDDKINLALPIEFGVAANTHLSFNASFVEEHLPAPHPCQVGVSLALLRVPFPWRQEEATGLEISAERKGGG
jgi:hypothetical protein